MSNNKNLLNQCNSLSIVVTSRNDNHGGTLTVRMQYFIDGLVSQCTAHNLKCELIIVEWNPPLDRPSLFNTLNWPKISGNLDIRIITVPYEIHKLFDNHEKLPLFQMIAKNVGIRRARGNFVLATNIDILFSDNAILFMKNQLKKGFFYRADRLDVPTNVPKYESFSNTLDWCWNNYFRINANNVTLISRANGWTNDDFKRAYMHPKIRYLKDNLKKLFLIHFHTNKKINSLNKFTLSAILKVLISPLRFIKNLTYLFKVLISPLQFIKNLTYLFKFLISPLQFIKNLTYLFKFLISPLPFTNACGDFTLMSRDDWFKINGYAEWPIYSFHIDSLALHQSLVAGLREIYIGKNAPVFHIEHGVGSGYTPENENPLFERLNKIGLPYLDYHKDYLSIIYKMRKGISKSNHFTYKLADENWGLANAILAETVMEKNS